MQVLQEYAPEGQYIFVLEAVAQCLALWVFWPFLRCPYWSFVDNAAAQWALSKGYSSCPEGNVLTTLFWAVAVRYTCDPWFERVPSKANCSDAISRGDLSFAKEHGWAECTIGLEETWKVLREALSSPTQDLPDVASRLCTSATFAVQ